MNNRKAVLSFTIPQVDFNNSVVWGEDLVGTYQDLPNLANQIEISYGTSLGVDAFQHVPFIDKMNGYTVITWQQGLTDEDTGGQSIFMSFLSGGSFSTPIEVIPSFSTSGVSKIVPINQRSIKVDNKWYYMASVFDATGGITPTSPVKGLIAVERLTASTFGTPFWVHTPSGSAPTPEATFPAYTFDEPTSGNIRTKIQSDEYQIFAYTDIPSGFDGVLTDGVDSFLEISAFKYGDNFVRTSRNFTASSPTNQRAYFDYGDGIPTTSGVPMPPMRGNIDLLKDNRVCLMNSYVSTNFPTDYRKEIWLSVADKNTLNFKAENTYRIAFGQDTGQIFAGVNKNGVWAYPHFIHDTDNKIKMVCSKYKEGIFLWEFDYSDLNITT